MHSYEKYKMPYIHWIDFFRMDVLSNKIDFVNELLKVFQMKHKFLLEWKFFFLPFPIDQYSEQNSSAEKWTKKIMFYLSFCHMNFPPKHFYLCICVCVCVFAHLLKIEISFIAKKTHCRLFCLTFCCVSISHEHAVCCKLFPSVFLLLCFL